MSNRSPLLNIIFQSLNKITRSVIRDFGEIENLQVSPNSLEKFVSKTKDKISTSLQNDLIKSRPDWGIKFNSNNEDIKDKFDLISVLHIIEHIDDDNLKDTFSKIKKLLNKDGNLLIATPAKNALAHNLKKN